MSFLTLCPCVLQVVTNKVKELLLAHNTGQKLFGEAVLGLSQVGGVSHIPLLTPHATIWIGYTTISVADPDP